MVNTPPLIAVLDDEPMFCTALGRLLKTHGFDVVVFGRESDWLLSPQTESLSLPTPFQHNVCRRRPFRDTTKVPLITTIVSEIRPINAPKNDFGMTTGLGWKFQFASGGIQIFER